MDNVFVRTAADLEKKYDLSKLAKKVSNIDMTNEQIVKMQNEINDIKKTLIINLGDTLQTSVSLWFYEGTPTTTNEPYIDWTTPSEHIDDFYYDQDSGYVYKYTTNGWVRQYDNDLISAMALTNAELDTSIDHERQVFLTQPTPPYQSGDWWIQEDGTLLICQLGKPTGTYENNDFVVSTMYTTTIATKQDDTIEVVKGTVTQITENAVFYTDKATGTTTAIAGDSITTGNIKSANYVQNVSGTKLSLTDGTIDSKNFKVNQYGSVTCNQISINGGDENNHNFNINDANTNREGFILPGGISFSRRMSNTKDIYAGFMNDYSNDSPINEFSMGLLTYNADHTSLLSNTQGISIRSYEDYGHIEVCNAGNVDIDLDGDTGEITCVHLTQTSQAEKKKNFEKLENALDIIKDIDIYKYNFKEENDEDKKHIGVVIGDNFNYSKEITSKDNDGIDIYSFISVCCQAIKEQQKQIDELKNEIARRDNNV